MTGERTARDRLGWLMEHMEPMQAIARSKTGRIELSGPDGKTFAVEAWPKHAREFLGQYRNRFAHGHTRVEQDGTVVVYRTEGQHRRRYTYPEREFGDLVDRVADAIYGRLDIRIDASVRCNTCGDCVCSNDTLTCGHVDYSDRPPNDGTVVLYEPPGATLTSVLMIGARGRGNHTIAYIPGMKQPQWWLMTFLESTAKLDSTAMQRQPKRCPCGNQASPLDGYCRNCRPPSSQS